MRNFAIMLITLLFTSLCFLGLAQTKAPEIKNEDFVAKVLTPLSASQNKKGDKFTLQVVEPAKYKNAMIEAEVAKAKAAGKVSGKSELNFSFEKLILKDGTTIPIIAELNEITNSKGVGNVDEEGHVIGMSSAKKEAARTAILGGIGAAIGKVASGSSGALKGAAIGAAIGLTISFSTRGEDIKFSPGSQFKLAVTSKKEQEK
jgi:hypothetical protein